MSIEGFLSGIALMAFGWGLLDKDFETWHVQHCIDSSNFLDRLGIPQASEEFRKKSGTIILNIMGWAFIICGLIALFRSFFGLVTFQ